MIVTMAYYEDLANRIRELIASEDGYTEQKNVRRNRLHDRRPHGKPGARPFEMRGLEMKGWLRVDPESVSTRRELEPWVIESVAFARALPPKKK